eukprot:5208354-Pleurochrysis_carterae.AAC.4
MADFCCSARHRSPTRKREAAQLEKAEFDGTAKIVQRAAEDSQMGRRDSGDKHSSKQQQG